MTIPNWRELARAAGWPEHRLDAFAVGLRDAAVVLVHRDVLALRTRLGALQTDLRGDDLGTIARAAAALAGVGAYEPPPPNPNLPSTGLYRLAVSKEVSSEIGKAVGGE